MAENKQYDHVKEITDQLETGLHDLFESEQYKTWLSTMGRFHDYSLNNTILIAQQKPDATYVAGYTSWQKNFGRQVKKGEKAIKILAPTPRKRKEEVDKVDPETGKILLDSNGQAQKETKEVVIPAFKVANVFDISSTEGRELPTLGVSELDGSVKQYNALFQALKDSCPVPISFEQIDSGAKGYYQLKEDRIAIQKGMSEVQTVKTLIHEMTHQKLHALHPELDAEPGPELTRNGREVEAESVAYTICQHYGIDTSDYSFAYIAGWSRDKEAPELKASMGRIRDASCEMITEIDGHLQERQQEMKRDSQAEELAVRLDQMEESLDPYEYRDQVSEREGHVSAIKGMLLEADDSLAGYVQAMQEIVLLNEDKEIPEIAEALDEIRDFLGDDPLAEELFNGELPDVPEEDAGKQENGHYRYYSIQRPVDIGTYPKPAGNLPVEIENFDDRILTDGGQTLAWGYLEYAHPLTQEQYENYELKPARTSGVYETGRDAEKPEQRSVLARFHEQKDDQDAEKQAGSKTKKEREDVR